MDARTAAARRWAALLLAASGTAGLWLVAGAPWWPPAAGLVAALTVRLLGRLLPPALRRPILAGGLVAVAVLAPELSVGAWLLAAAVVALVVLATGIRPGGRGQARVLLGMALLLAVSGTVGLVVEHLQAEQRRQQMWAQAAQLNRAQLLPASPGRAAGLLLHAVAAGDPGVCPVMFTPDAGAEFAAAVATTDCEAGVRVLAGRVLDPHRYPTPDATSMPQSAAGDDGSATLDLCHLSWGGATAVWSGASGTSDPPGPQVGRFDLVRVLGQGYQVTRFTPC